MPLSMLPIVSRRHSLKSQDSSFRFQVSSLVTVDLSEAWLLNLKPETLKPAPLNPETLKLGTLEPET
jgi:hypothetical protein